MSQARHGRKGSGEELDPTWMADGDRVGGEQSVCLCMCV
jgi:hypothetical protein